MKQQMKEVISILQHHEGKLDFFDLFEADDKPTLVMTFLSILELMKRQIVIVEQSGNFDELTVMLKEGDVDDEQLESIDE